MAATAPQHQPSALSGDGTASAIASARRALVAGRYAPDTFAVEWRPLSELAPIAAAWRALAAHALEPNVFYEPAFALAAAPVFAGRGGAVLVWSGTEPRRLLGFFPGRIENRRYGLGPPVLVGWTHPYGPLGVPLVEREAAEPVIAAWLAHLAAAPSLPGLLLLPFLPEDGPFAAALAPILRRAQMPAADFARHQRALLKPDGDRSRYIERALGRHQRKEIRRRWRRLGDIGAALITTATEPAAVDAALADFLALEAGGWKGRAGTAAAGSEELRGFVRAAVNALARDSKAAVGRLLLDGRAVAAAIVLHSGRSAFFWKIAYDEAFARFSPGVMLSVAVTEELIDDPAIIEADSCATADHPMIDHLWRERLPIVNRLVAVRPGVPFALVSRLEGLRTAAIAVARSVRQTVRGRRS